MEEKKTKRYHRENQTETTKQRLRETENETRDFKGRNLKKGKENGEWNRNPTKRTSMASQGKKTQKENSKGERKGRLKGNLEQKSFEQHRIGVDKLRPAKNLGLETKGGQLQQHKKAV